MADENSATIRYSVSKDAAHRAVVFNDLSEKPLWLLDNLATLFNEFEEADSPLSLPHLAAATDLEIEEDSPGEPDIPILDTLSEYELIARSDSGYEKDW